MSQQTLADAMATLSRLQEAKSAAVVQHAAAAGQPWSPELVLALAGGVLGFALIAMLLAASLLRRCGAGGIHILRVFGVLTILAFSALLLIIGYTNEQLTPIIGLFGAVAGYLLGKEARN